jgi:hypothetical protein
MVIFNSYVCLPEGSWYWLVVEPTPLKNMKVRWDDYSQYTEKVNMFQTTNQNILYIDMILPERL